MLDEGSSIDSRVPLQSREKGDQELPAFEAGTSGVVTDETEEGKDSIGEYLRSQRLEQRFMRISAFLQLRTLLALKRRRSS